MKRSRLKNIINKSKSVSNKQEVGNPFDEFKKSLPIEVDDDYRLEAAWKAYGSPKDYKAALWEGMIQPIDENTYKLPSIGYNEETDEYEYLNKGKDNETVAKDIRVWDNDVIPLVQELKLGGYVRTFNEEKDCWTYTKNSQKREQPVEDKGEQVINSFQKGGKPKPKFEDWYKTVPPEKSDTTDYDLEKAYNELPFEELEAFRTIPEKHLDGRFKKPNHITYSDEGYGWIGSDKIGWTFYPSPRQQQLYPYEKYVEYWNQNEPNSILNYNGKIYKVSPQAFKQGGQMNVIPEGALHARKNNMEGAGKDFTHKGIPVIDDDGKQQAEIEREEVIFNKEVTEKLENYYKQYNDDSKSQSEKDEIAIKAGKLLAKQLMENTEDRTGLIEKVEAKS